MFTYTIVNLFDIDTSDYKVVADILKLNIKKYNARLLVYDANGIGAAIRDWLNRESVDEYGTIFPGYGIINPPTNAKKDIIRYNQDRTICYEVKATGEKADQIHQVFFSRISNGAVRFLIKSSDAINKFSLQESFKHGTNQYREKKLRPYLFMDRMELELKNLEIVDTSDNVNRAMRIRRRDKKIQKDFFSAAEYAVYATNLFLELDYYGQRRRMTGAKAEDFVLID